MTYTVKRDKNSCGVYIVKAQGQVYYRSFIAPVRFIRNLKKLWVHTQTRKTGIFFEYTSTLASPLEAVTT